ncbi:MAG: RDD family protein [Promethearchaeota archaeon]|jgi:uncharacterized RDD family membrane protein YckC
MSTERIEYNDAPPTLRIVAILIDIVLVVILAVISQFGFSLEYELFWKTFVGEFDINSPYWYVFWFIIELPLYFWLVSSLTDGQTLGKGLLGIRVMTNDYTSTKRKWKLHLKRTFQIRGGTKVVKEKDPEVKGL